MNNATQTVPSRQPKKATSACEVCRALKVKCIQPEEGQPYVPDQTLNVYFQSRDSEIEFHNERDRRGLRRLADLESKLANIIGLLSRSSAPHGGIQTPVETGSGLPAIPDYFSSSPHPAAELISQGYLAGSELDESPELSDNQNATENTPKESYGASTAMDAAWITDLGLGLVVLDHLLDTFRGMVSYFPFVQLSESWTAASMAEDRPFLLLAAVAAASSKFCHLQDALIRQFKESLSKRVVMAGEKDLDLLQGLLVHLAWFQFHFIPGSQQDYLYLQIAISMVIDLHLDQEAADLLERRTELGNIYTREACRAYLGCYYLSGIITMSSGRPNNLQYHKNMLPCAMMLQQQPEFETDSLIYPVTKVLQFAEEVCETYRSEVLLINAYHTVKIRIQEMGLVYRYGPRKTPVPKAQADSTLLSVPPMVISNLIKCVTSTKESLDSFLAIPVTGHCSLPFSTWYQLILTVFVLYRLSVGLLEVPEWNVEIAQQTVDLQAYFDTLLSYLHIMKSSPDRQIPTKSLFSRIPEIMESVRTSYALAREDIVEVRDSSNAHHELNASNNTASSVQRLRRCPALRYSNRQVTQAPSQPAPQNAIAMEIQRIEDEKLWGDLLVMETPSII
ncbi:conserved hypothetical protein [Talaromyces marneffei ATCC 18224]|uniref:Transcription factor domain-containing protein n=1 Tax=Talaromyces marneffei (strain ATCC 18224 / CBS 334.59 / QM 7333) TaxID=441960 RepID=B6QCQ0_TALMQ|nr:conserved hypothetical protein [Talaromyces marneffei ATCC 18224]